MIKINKKDILKWTQALRSGKYKQGFHTLENLDHEFCCLGVACKIFIPSNKQKIFRSILEGSLPDDQYYAPGWLKEINGDLWMNVKISLAMLNDKYQLTFDEIADVLEAVYIHKVLD